jgi:hypothetical protein
LYGSPRLERNAEECDDTLQQERGPIIGDAWKQLIGLAYRYARLVKLNYLAPDIVAAILDGQPPLDLTVRKLIRSTSRSIGQFRDRCSDSHHVWTSAFRSTGKMIGGAGILPLDMVQPRQDRTNLDGQALSLLPSMQKVRLDPDQGIVCEGAAISLSNGRNAAAAIHHLSGNPFHALNGNKWATCAGYSRPV